jgi:hypothetical protein
VITSGCQDRNFKCAYYKECASLEANCTSLHYCQSNRDTAAPGRASGSSCTPVRKDGGQQSPLAVACVRGCPRKSGRAGWSSPTVRPSRRRGDRVPCALGPPWWCMRTPCAGLAERARAPCRAACSDRSQLAARRADPPRRLRQRLAECSLGDGARPAMSPLRAALRTWLCPADTR